MSIEEMTVDPSLMERIRRSVSSGRVSHAYLIEGPAYLDKPAFAREFVRQILCPRGRADHCGSCAICDKIDHDNHEDLIYIQRLKGKQSLGIDQVRHMQAQIAIKPNGPRYIVIIEECDLMTEEAQNCLLKTLEEPPAETVLILLADNDESLLPTVRSRCVRYRIEGTGQIPDQQLAEQADALTQQILRGEPFYQMKKTLGEGRMDRQQAMELIDCMEEQCRQRILTRDEKGILCSSEEIRRCIDGLESARQQLMRGMNPGYVMKRMLLSI